MKKKTNAFTLVMTLFLCLFGILLAMGMRSMNDNYLLMQNANQDLTDLREEAMALVRENGIIAEENESINERINALSNDLAGDDASLQEILQEINEAKVFAGLTDISGNGIRVTIDYDDECEFKAGTLLLIVNEMRASGGYAIDINGERLVALTEIRDAGSASPVIIINGNSYSSQSVFTITCLYQEADIERGEQLVGQLLEQYSSFGQLQLDIVESITIPALSPDSMTYQHIMA
ncbi:MAG TPA: DUF881 domain-containing protein [Bacillota bacterium]|nr:DUF881 domain-containing protein [Bacillota bacterium]HPE39377.1 DUF881 domain-containing protein [Bacillota bacterium]